MNPYIFFWDINLRNLPRALFYMGYGHLLLRFNANVAFYKLLGTGKGDSFTPRDANPKRWGLLVICSEDPKNLAIVKKWRSISTSERFFELAPISSHGKWSGVNPFVATNDSALVTYGHNRIAAITRAKIKNRLAFQFWRATPPVINSLKNSAGLIWAIGIGESPIGLQGTFSLWESETALKIFAYQEREHKVAITKTKELGWYSEELFARFQVLSGAE